MMPKLVGNPSFQRQANSLLILNALRQGPLSRTELSDMTGLQPSTVTYSTARLIQKDLVIEIGSSASKGGVGRRRSVLSLNGDFGRFVGAELMESSFRLVVCDMKGEVIGMDEFQYQASMQLQPRGESQSRALFLEHLAQVRLQAELMCGNHRCFGLGLSVPAVVSEDGTSILQSWVHGLEDEHFKDELSSFPFKVHLENDARLCALQSSGKGDGNLAYVLVKTSGLSSISIGVGLVLGGRLYRGAHGRSGEYRSSRVAGMGIPAYQQVADSSDGRASAWEILSDLLCMASILDISRIYLNFDVNMGGFCHEALERLAPHGCMSRELISLDVSIWDSAQGAATMMVEEFFDLPQIGDYKAEDVLGFI